MNQVLRDSMGRKIAEIKSEGNRDVIRDPMGKQLGYFDGRYTYDPMGKKVGEGNLLTSLIR